MGAPAASTSLPSLRLPSARPPAPDAGADAVYRRRDPTATALYPIVQHHLESFLAHATDADPFADALPGWVEEDFRAYLRCGILAHGFARARCDDCGSERLVAFSCRGRAVCPSPDQVWGRLCNTRRMVEVAAYLSDAVLPPLPVLQWVFSLPPSRAAAAPRTGPPGSCSGAAGWRRANSSVRSWWSFELSRSSGSPADGFGSFSW
jgi:hypothetical protein